MTRIILSGANGVMGRAITANVRERTGCTIVAGIDKNAEMTSGFHVFTNPADCTAEADVIVDFSHTSALTPLLEMAKARKLPIVIATTGYGSSQIEEIHAASREIPVFFTFNMSLGVNLMVELSKAAARVLGPDFDIEIIERHHNKKIDAPSGTALMLADAVASALGDKPQYTYDRHSARKPRGKNEIGIHSVRGGTIVGEHEVVFAGKDEIVTISHSARSKQVFATGAINAAVFMAGKQAGLYSMSDLLA